MTKLLTIAFFSGLLVAASSARADVVTKQEAHEACMKYSLQDQTLEQLVEKGAGPSGAQVMLDFTNRYIKCMAAVRNTGDVPAQD